MKHRPLVVAFDVIETLFPLEPLRGKLKEAGLPGSALETLFVRILRDGMALTLTGDFKPFPEVASAALEGLLAEHSAPATHEKIEQVLGEFGRLPPHEDVRPSLELLHSAGLRTLALTNGTLANTQKLLDRAGLAHLVERIVTIEEVHQWKPARAVYLQAALSAAVEVGQIALVAAHAWDLRGAAAAGMITAWLPRQERRFSDLMGRPDIKASTLLDAVQQILKLPPAD